MHIIRSDDGYFRPSQSNAGFFAPSKGIKVSNIKIAKESEKKFPASREVPAGFVPQPRLRLYGTGRSAPKTGS